MFGEHFEQIRVLPAKILLEARQQFFHLLFGKRLDPGEDLARSLQVSRAEQAGR